MATADRDDLSNRDPSEYPSPERKAKRSERPPDSLARAILSIALLVLVIALILLAAPVIRLLVIQLLRQLERLWFLIQSFS